MSSPTTSPASRDLLLDLYRAATAAAAPGPALEVRLRELPADSGRRLWIFALGKAAVPMATTAVEVLRAPETGWPAASSWHPKGASVPTRGSLSSWVTTPSLATGSFAAATALAATASRGWPR